MDTVIFYESSKMRIVRYKMVDATLLDSWPM